MNTGDLILGGSARGDAEQIQIGNCPQGGVESFRPFGVARAGVMLTGNRVSGKRGGSGVGAHDAIIA